MKQDSRGKKSMRREYRRETVYNKFNGRCAYCGNEITKEAMQVDHIIPQANYSAWVRTGKNIPPFLAHLTETGVNSIDNLFPSCRPCNFHKGTMDIELFRSEIGKQLERARKESTKLARAFRYCQVVETGAEIKFYFEIKSFEI